jgi:hypothetical protein
VAIVIRIADAVDLLGAKKKDSADVTEEFQHVAVIE